MIPQLDDFLAAYRRAGLDVIKIEGSSGTDNRWAPKRPGYGGWDDPRLKFTDDELRFWFQRTERIGTRCGYEFGLHVAVDFDLEKCLTGLSLADVRAFRKSLIPQLRALETPIVFTPGGGFHVHFRLKEWYSPAKMDSVIASALGSLFAVDQRVRPNLIRGASSKKDKAGMVLIPPSLIRPNLKYVGHTGAYFFLDSVQTLQNFTLREL